MGLQREVDQFPVTIPVVGNIADATILDMRKFSGGRLKILTGTPTSLTFYEAAYGETAANHKLCLDVTAVTCAVSQTVEIPPALFACHSLVIIANSAGTALVLLKT